MSTITPEWVGLSLVPQLGGRTLRTLLAQYNHDAAAIMAAPTKELMQIRGIGQKIAHAITTIDLDKIVHDMHQWQQQGIQLYGWDAAQYPAALRALDDAPPLLFIRGDHFRSPVPSVAIVGTRHPKPARYRDAQTIAANCAQANMTVISGMALGVDSAAHLGALALPDGYTLAILGGGVLTIYPPQNQALADTIRMRGALISENAPDAAATAQRLVARNRLITGMAQIVVIVETANDGGAMHAARFAQKQEKPVFALDIAAHGNQTLIAQGIATPLSPQILGNPMEFVATLGIE